MRGNSKQQQQQSSDDLDDLDGDEPYHNMNGSKPNNLARRSNNPISNNTRKQQQQQQQSQQDDIDVTSGGLNAEQTAALAALFMAPGLDPEERISMFHVKDGTRVTGSKAPKRGDLTRWLNAHPGFLPDESEIMNLTLKNQQQQQQQTNEQQRLRRKSSLKPIQDYAETSSLEDEELAMAASSSSSSSRQRQPPSNNSNNNNANNNKSQMMKGPPAPNQNVDLNAPLILFNKLTNKKLSGQKVPNWKMLAAFLDKNEQIYIDPTCNELVRAKYGGRANVPDIVKSRMINLGSSSSNKSNMNKQPPPASSQTTNSRTNTQTNSNSGNNSSSSNNRNSSKSNSNGAHHHIEPPQDPSGFNPFELQGLTELLAASGAGAGQFDMNNPLAGFMAAALAAQGQAGAFGAGPGMPPGAGFNSFLMPPFGATCAAAANTPDLGFMAELLSKMPPGKIKDEFRRGLLEIILCG